MNSAQNGSSGYSPQSPIVLQKVSAARQEHNAKHSLKCDEYSMKQNPNFKKNFISFLCMNYFTNRYLSMKLPSPPNTHPQKHIQVVPCGSCKSSSHHRTTGANEYSL